MPYYQDGQKKQEATFVADSKQGKFTAWHATGQKSIEQTFHDGSPHGTLRRWYNDGTPQEETKYVQGVKQPPGPVYRGNKHKSLEVEYADGTKHGHYAEIGTATAGPRTIALSRTARSTATTPSGTPTAA